MSNLNKIIDIEFLKDRAACIEGIAYFEEEIKEPIAAREVLTAYENPTKSKEIG